MSADLTFAGVERVAANLTKFTESFTRDAARALRAEAEIEMTEAKRRCPVDTGALRSSGTVGEVQVGLGGFGKNISVPMTFGGPAAPYAVIVHEDLEAMHPVGQAKYLESVLLESAPYMAQRVARRMGSA